MFAKDTFTARMKENSLGIVSIGRSTDSNYKTTELVFEYNNSLGIRINSGSVPNGRQVEAIIIYYDKNDVQDFNEAEYADREAERVVPIVDRDNYEYLEVQFISQVLKIILLLEIVSSLIIMLYMQVQSLFLVLPMLDLLIVHL